jgi:hypothetical protein
MAPLLPATHMDEMVQTMTKASSQLDAKYACGTLRLAMPTMATEPGGGQ